MASHYWIRIPYIALSNIEEIHRLIDFCHRCRASGVLLFTANVDTEPGLLTMDEVQKRAARIKTVVPLFLDAGFDVHINVHSTLGHGSPTANTVERLGFQPMIDHLGQASDTAPCPLDPAFLAYAAELYGRVAATGASAVWIDDDMRYMGHGTAGTGCFCLRHLERTGERLGRAVSREEIIELIMLEYPVPTPERLAWQTANNDAMIELTQTIRAAVDAVNLEVELGLMTVGTYAHASEGRDTPTLLEALNPKHTRWFRPGAGFWNDERPRDVVEKTEDALRQTVLAGTNVLPVSEVENYPRTRATKSNTILELELSLNALAGLSNQNLNLFSTLQSIDESYDDVADLLAEKRPWLDAVATEIDGTKRIGVGIAAHEVIGSLLPPVGTDFIGARTWSPILARLGIPLGEPTGAPHFISDRMADIIEPEHIGALATDGIVLDGPALARIHQRGIGGLLGLKSVRSTGVCGYERLTGDTLNGVFTERLLSWRRGENSGAWVPEPSSPGAHMLSRFLGVGGSDLGPAIVATEIPGGGRVVMLPWALPDAHQIVNDIRREQLQALMVWASRGCLPVRVTGSPNVYPVVRTNDDDTRRLLALTNLSYDTAQNAVAQLDTGFWKVERLTASGSWRPDDDIGSNGCLCARIHPWDTMVYRLTR